MTQNRKLTQLKYTAVFMLIIGAVIMVQAAILFNRFNAGECTEAEILARSTDMIQHAMSKSVQEDVLAVELFETINMFRSALRESLLSVFAAGFCLFCICVTVIAFCRTQPSSVGVQCRGSVSS